MKSDDIFKKIDNDKLQHLQRTIDSIPKADLYAISGAGIEQMSNAGVLALGDSLLKVAKMIDEVTRQQLQRAKGISLFGDMPEQQQYRMLQMQLSAVAEIGKYAQTAMIESLQKSLRAFDVTACATTMSTVLKQTLIEAADLSYIHTSELAKAMRGALVYPKGVKSALSDLNISASKRLAKCDDVSFEPRSRKFVVEAEPKCNSSVSEMNVICSGAGVLETIATEDDFLSPAELILFMSQLENSLSFGTMLSAGRKIFEALRDYAKRIGFDCNDYYHGRVIEPETCPYTEQDMLTAPHSVPSSGRYNRAGTAYYYFANSCDGVVAEIRKHSKNACVQVAQICPIKSIDLIDLSDTMRGGTTFLKYIRYQLKSDTVQGTPREYLIPNYVSDCCRHLGVDGIKYYGGKGYSNYVSWNCGYFKFGGMRIVEAA